MGIAYNPVRFSGTSSCGARTRHGFFDEREQHKSPTAKQALDRIAAFYAVEERAAFAPLAERVELRRQSCPPCRRIFRLGQRNGGEAVGQI
jgi:hypothetical protein